MTDDHKILSVTDHEHGRIERRQGARGPYYQAHRDDGDVSTFARKRDAEKHLSRSTKDDEEETST